MSVPKGRRAASKMEFVKIAYKLQSELLLWLARDFGTKGRIRTPEDFCQYYNIQAEDQELLIQILRRNNVRTIKDEYDPDLIYYFKNELTYGLMRLIKNIDCANEVFVTTEIDFNVRREYQDKAISYCKHIQYILTSMKHILKFVLRGHIMEYADDTEKLLHLLRGWKNKDYESYKKLIKDHEKANELERKHNVNINTKSSITISNEQQYDLIEDNFYI